MTFRQPTRRVLPAAAGALAAVLVLFGGRPLAGQQAPVRTLGGGTDVAVLDFLALTADGRPVRDLRKEELTLRVSGRTRTIRSLELVQVARLPVGSTDRDPPAPLPKPFGSNTLEDIGRSVVLVIEDETIRPGRETETRESIFRFLGLLSPLDRVALITVPHGGVLADLTTDRDRIRQAVRRFSGQAPQSESGSEAACRTRQTLQALAGTIGSLQGRDGPPIVVFFSSSLMGLRRDAPMMLAPGMCELTAREFQQVSEAAARARALVYIVKPEVAMIVPGAVQTENIAGVGFTGPTDPLAGLEHLAGATGGLMRYLTTSSGEHALDRVARETASYYVATFEPESGERGHVHQAVDLRVSRPDVVLRVKPDVWIPRAEAPAARGPAPSVASLLVDAAAHRSLPLRAAAFPARLAPDNPLLKVVTLLEPSDPELRLAAAAAALIDDAGRIVAQWSAQPGDLLSASPMAALAAPPGSYRLRVAATDAEGRAATVDYPVDVELVSAGPVRISGLALGLSRAGGFVPKLAFGVQPTAIAYLELYGPPNTAVGIAIELATTVNGPPIIVVNGAVDATSEPDRFQVVAALPIGPLPPGDYVVRAIIEPQGHAAARVIRTLRKTAGD